ncbi:MAG: hypothetical protein IJ802_00650 [Kiritimatiellae bacterium]|nr:hypothetical protein [Kiritimatiellia bacterium]
MKKGKITVLKTTLDKELSEEYGMISFSVVFSRLFLARLLNGHLALPKGLGPAKASCDKKLIDLLRKYRDRNQRLPSLTKRRMSKGDYGLAGIRMYQLVKSLDSDSYTLFSDFCSSSVGDYTLSEEYENAVKQADKELLTIANSEQSTRSQSNSIPQSIIQSFLLCERSGKIESPFLCQCFLFSLALFDANPNMKSKIFRELFNEPADGCKNAIVTILRRHIKNSGIAIKEFASKMHPNSSDPRKVFDANIRDVARITQPQFIKKFAETYYDICFDEANKKEGLREYISCLWSFIIQSAVCMDKMQQKLNFDFQAEAKERYGEFLSIAINYYPTFSRNE